MAKILLVDDEPDIVEFLRYNLEKENYEVIVGYNGTEALTKLNEKPDLILLDIMMPGIDGFEVCKKIKEDNRYKKIPIVFLTALPNESDEIKGLDIGASDFIKKPISPLKLISRVRKNLLQIAADESTKVVNKRKIIFNNIIIDPESFKIHVNGKEKFFPRKEFFLIYLLASYPDKVFTREELLKKIWGEGIMVIDRTVDVHIRKIREKLGEYSNLIHTIKGVGYKFHFGSSES